MIKLNNETNNPLIRHLQGEVNIALADGKNEQDINDIVSIIYPLLNKGYDYSQIRRILTQASNFISRSVITPLNLSIGEFRFVKPGLSINNRNPNVCMDNQGIFYNNAFRAKVVNCFDAYTDRQLPIDCISGRTPYIRGVFILSGGIITNYYFDIAYLHKQTVERKSFYPASPINIEVRAYIYKQEYILVAKANNPKIKALMQMYNVPIKECRYIGCENFGINTNINKDELFKKITSVGI